MTLSIPAVLLDVTLVSILVITALSYMRKGFAAGIVKLVGNVIAIGASLVVSNKLAPFLFEKFFKEGLITRTQDLVAQQGVPYLEGIVEEIASFLPIDFVQNIIRAAVEAIDVQSATLAQDIVNLTFKPLFVPLISVVLFLISYTILAIIVSQVSVALIKLNSVPIIGGLNRILGLVTGVIGGALEVLIVLCVLWAFITLTNSGVPFINGTEFAKSIFYSTFSGVNPFLIL